MDGNFGLWRQIWGNANDELGESDLDLVSKVSLAGKLSV